MATFEATNSQIELYEVLGDLGIKNVNSSNAAAYLTGKQDFLNDLTANDKELTVEAIQTYVNDVNAEQVTDAEKAEAAKAVATAVKDKNNIELKKALNNKAFTKVNNNWIEDIGLTPGYATELFTGGGSALALDGTDTAADVQAGIDAVNEAVIAAEISSVAPATSVDKAEMAELKTLIETYAPVNEDNEYVTGANQTALDNIKRQSAVADSLAATTASKFKATVTALADIANTPGTSDVIDLADYVDANGKAYIDTIKDLNSANPTLTDSDYGVSGKVNTAAEIASVISKVNDVQADKGAVGKYEALETAAQNVQTTATASNKSKFVSALQAVGIKQVSSNTANVNAYVSDAAAIESAAAAVNGTSDVNTAKTTIQGKVDDANLAVVKAADATNIVAALNVLELKNVVAANASQYAASAADTSTSGAIGEAGTDDAAKVQTAINAINSDVAVAAAVKAINEATAATQVKTALDTLANEGELTNYLNVTAADRIFIAEKVLKTRDTLTAGRTLIGGSSPEASSKAKEYFNEGEIDAEVTNATSARTTAIGQINGLDNDLSSNSLTVIAQYLHDVGHESLTGTRANPSAHDTVVAENFWKSLTFNQAGDEVSPKFTSIAAIRTAITNANK